MDIITDVDTAIRAFQDEPRLAYDLETNALQPWEGSIAVVTLAAPDKRVAVLHVRGAVPARLWRFLESRESLMGHNVVNFDTVWSAVHGMDVYKTKWVDTMVAEQCVLPAGRPDFRASLADTLERRFRSNRDARKRVIEHGGWMAPELTHEQLEYAAHDVVHLFELYDTQRAKAAGTPLEQALELETSILPAVSAMKINGLPISLKEVWDLTASKEATATPLAVELKAKFGIDNLRSPQQLKAALNAAGIPVTDTTWATFKDLELRSGDPNSAAAKIIRWKANDQILKMFSDKWIREHVQQDNRVHGSFWQLGTDTGRFSSTEPNLQQQPKEARCVYRAPEGWRIVSCDYSQIEVRIAAAQAHDSAMLSIMDTEDVHTAVASQMFSVPVSEVTKKERSLAKACVFTLLFAGSAERLYSYTRLAGGDLSLQEAKILFAKFFATYQGLREAREKATGMSYRKTLAITLPTGIKRILVGQSLTPQTVLNTMVQGTAAAGLKYALRECVRQGLHEYLGATVHDELVACVPEEVAADYAEKLREAMIVGMRVVTDAPLRAEVRIGEAWGERPVPPYPYLSMEDYSEFKLRLPAQWFDYAVFDNL